MAEATTGYYRPGRAGCTDATRSRSSWRWGWSCWRRSAAAGGPAGPRWLIVVLAAWSAGLLRPMLASADPGRALRHRSSWSTRSSSLARGTSSSSSGRWPDQRRTGLRGHLGGSSAGRLPGIGAVPVHDPGRRHARGAGRAWGQPSIGVRRPLGRPDGAAHAGSGGCHPRRAAGARPAITSARCRSGRERCVPLIGPVLLGSLIDVRERTFALEARGFGARPARTAYREVVDPPADRVLRLAAAPRVRRRHRGRLADPFRL